MFDAEKFIISKNEAICPYCSYSPTTFHDVSKSIPVVKWYINDSHQFSEEEKLQHKMSHHKILMHHGDELSETLEPHICEDNR